MTPTHVQSKSLSGKIFATLLAFVVVVVLVLGFVFTGIFYLSSEQRAASSLMQRAENAAATLNGLDAEEDKAILATQFDTLVRYTLIDVAGNVVFDSRESADSMENHSDRPEVSAAVENGEAASSRYSETLRTDTLYAAVELDDGRVIRLSEDRQSLFAFIGDMLAPMMVALAVAIATVFALSRLLTRRIMKPIDALDFSSPLDNDIYIEMDPLLVRIDEQQRQLVQQNEELALAENMRRDFSSNVSHEMKTPLQVISGYAELMKNDMIEPGDRQRFAELIYDEAQAMRSLINDVLTLSMLDESALGEGLAEVNVYAVVERVAGRISSFADRMDVTVGYRGEAAYIAGNETLVEEMIYNLVENGIRYNHPGGSVQVTVEREASAEPLPKGNGFSSQQIKSLREAGLGDRLVDEHASGVAASGKGGDSGSDARSNAEQRHVVIRVADTGPGIPEELHEKVFERFFRLEKSRSKETGGTGLGLAIVKHAVLYHGGAIKVESAEGVGTTFVLRFPDATRLETLPAS